MAESIDLFENPFLGMEANIRKNLGETDASHNLVASTAEAGTGDGEQ